MIRVNNLDVQSHLRQVNDKVESIIPSRELICYHREQIKGRIIVLVAMVSSLNHFNQEFNLDQPIPEIIIDGLIPFYDDL